MNLPNTYENISLIAEKLSTIKSPAISAYELGKLAFQSTLPYDREISKKEYDKIVEVMQTLHLLESIDRNIYRLFGSTSATPAEIVCSVDPFSYVSHLSAMEFHGITDRFPKILYMTRPSTLSWKSQATERMHKELGDSLARYEQLGLPKLTKHKLEKIGKTHVIFHERSQLGAFRVIPDSPLRVATMGRVFLDMVREPQNCGGFQHVIDVYINEAKRFTNLITDEVERHGQPIDKVRVGYLLSEVCNIEHPIFNEWEHYAQRGGSRKLDSEGEYAADYSERWMLSINVPSLTSKLNDYDE